MRYNDFNCYQYPHEYQFYTGEKYSGILIDTHDNPKTTFLIPTARLREWKKSKLSNNYSSLNNFGYEIKDFKSIITVNRFAPEGSSFNDLGSFNLLNHTPNGFKYKKLIVFGAGASYACSFGSDLVDFRPPLVNELFDERFKSIYNKYPSVSNSISHFRFMVKTQGLEKIFQDEWAQINDSYLPELLRNHINLQYYLKDLLGTISTKLEKLETNLYDVFAKKLYSYLIKNPNESISIVTFNYDTAIEKAIERVFGYTFDDINSYINPEYRIHLYKVHGSCNWGWRLYNIPHTNSTQMFSNYLYSNKIDIHTLNTKHILDDNYSYSFKSAKLNSRNNKIRISPTNDQDHPAILIPYSEKDELLLPFNHINSLDNELDTINELYLIGWKGYEMAFNQLLTSSIGTKKVAITIANPESENVTKNLKPYFTNASWKDVKSFEDLCADNALFN